MEKLSFNLMLVASLVTCLAAPYEACTAARHHATRAAAASSPGLAPEAHNSVSNFPSLFAFDTNATAAARRAAACAGFPGAAACDVVFARPSALRERKVLFPLDRADPARYAVLKKVSEEGIRFLDGKEEGARGPTIVNFKVGETQ